MRLAVIGFGKMGVLHSTILNLLSPGSVRIIVEKSRLLRMFLGRVLRGVGVYSDAGRLSENSVDAVYVTTPTQTHYHLISDLIGRGGWMMFVEKPPTTSYGELRSLLSRGGSKRIMVGLQKRFSLPIRHARLLLKQGLLGSVSRVNAYIRSGSVLDSARRYDRLGRGVMLDLGIHLADLLEWFFGAGEVLEARGRSIHTGVDDYVYGRLRGAGGEEIVFEATWSDPRYRLVETYVRVEGERGVMEFTEDYLRVKVSTPNPLLCGEDRLEAYKPHYYAGIPPVNLAEPEYTLEDMHFLAVASDSSEPATSLPRVAGSMRLVEDVYEAMRLE